MYRKNEYVSIGKCLKLNIFVTPSYGARKAACFMLVSYLAYSSTLKT
jgi:hypothetical protein